MPQPTKLLLTELESHLRQADVFVCSASFESRSKCIAEHLGGMRFERSLVCANENFPHVLRSSGKQLQALLGPASRLVMLSTNEPLRTADSLQIAIGEAVGVGLRRFLVDITTFTHESLLILLRVFQVYAVTSVDFLYTGAKDYSVGDADERKWLSKGIGEVRSVLGYPGRAVPSRRLHLIVMAGFEVDRAERLLQQYEPSKVSIGLGDPADSISPSHYNTNRLFHQRLIEKYANVLQFTFSPSDPEATLMALRLQVGLIAEHNVLIAPLNTKISTIGAALVAFEDEGIQLCYATAHQYNEKRYSSPGDYCYYFSTLLPVSPLFQA